MQWAKHAANKGLRQQMALEVSWQAIVKLWTNNDSDYKSEKKIICYNLMLPKGHKMSLRGCEMINRIFKSSDPQKAFK